MKKKNPDSRNSFEIVGENDWDNWVTQRFRSLGFSQGSNPIIFLEGELGSGKSTLARSILKYLGFTHDTKGSPSFPLVHSYENSQVRASHIDIYRLKSEEELQDSGIEEELEKHDRWVLIEWSSLFPEYFKYWFDPSQSKMRKRSVLMVKILPSENSHSRKVTTIEF